MCAPGVDDLVDFEYDVSVHVLRLSAVRIDISVLVVDADEDRSALSTQPLFNVPML